MAGQGRQSASTREQRESSSSTAANTDTTTSRDTCTQCRYLEWRYYLECRYLECRYLECRYLDADQLGLESLLDDGEAAVCVDVEGRDGAREHLAAATRAGHVAAGVRHLRSTK